MKGSIMGTLKKYVAIFLSIALFITSVGINGAAFDVFAADPTHTGTVNVSDSLNVRSGPGTTYKVVGSLGPKTTVTIYETKNDNSGVAWYKIGYGSGFGYVRNDYIINVTAIPKYDFDADFETNLTKQNFPESYKVLLRKLHANHPQWIFMADHLSMTWEEAVDAESVVGLTLVQNGVSSIPDSWKSMAQYAYDWEKKAYVSYDTGNWVTAEREVVEYYMEPRNFLNEDNIFMFLDQSYNSNLQNAEGLQKVLDGTFMEGEFPEDTYDTYNAVIMDAAKQSGVSPYVLASMIIIEQGSKGTGASISGTQKGYEGIYNFFNFNAYASGGLTAVANGLKFASSGSTYERPWNTRAKSIIGGAKYYGKGYVSRGQDTFYYKKFNVISPSFYANQYMTNVQGAVLEARESRDAYKDSEAELIFSIPVYKSMSSENTTALPTSKGANNYYITALKVNGTAVEGFSMYKNDYEMIVQGSVSEINIAATVPSGASVSGAGKVSLKQGKNEIKLTVTAASGKKAVYVLSVFREAGGSSEPDPVPEPTVEGTYNISTYVSGIKPGTDVGTFIKTFNVKNGTVKVFSSSNSQKTSGLIATGDSVAVYDNEGNQKLKYNIVLFGDTSSDGKVSIVDLARVQKHLLEVNKLSGSQNTAADVNRDGKVSILDLARVQKHLLEITEIQQ